MTPHVFANGGKTGHPPGLLQDDCRKLSKWLASRMNARQEVREVCRLITQEKTMNDKTAQTMTDELRAMAASNSDLYEYERLQLKDAADTIDNLRAQLAEAQRDAEVNKQINRACAELPDDFRIAIELERNAACVYLIQEDEDIGFFDDPFDGVAPSISAAIDAAMGEPS